MSEPEVMPQAADPPPRKWRLIALLLLLALLAPVSWLTRHAASRMEFFQLRSVAVEGTRYLAPEAVLERLALDTTHSVWDDTEPLLARLRSMPQVAEATIRRRLPGTLVVRVREKLPIALAGSPHGFDPVDSAGVVLPIDLERSDVDLPVARQRDKPILALLAETRAKNPMLYRRISEIGRDGSGGLMLSLTPFPRERVAQSAQDGDSAATHLAQSEILRVRVPVGVSVSRLADIFPVESDLMRRRANVAELDLRYRDQVIARLQ